MASCIRDSISHGLISTSCVNDGTLECLCFDIYPKSSCCRFFILVYRLLNGSFNTLNVGLRQVDYLSRNIPPNPNSRCHFRRLQPSILGTYDLFYYQTVCDNLTQKFAGFCTHYFGLLQHVTSPTRSNNTLVFTPNVSDTISNIRVSTPICTSDHSTVSFNLYLFVILMTSRIMFVPFCILNLMFT